MKTLIGVLVALALAASVSACGGDGTVDPCYSPTAPGCNTGGGVPASTVAAITGIKVKLGNDVLQPASVTETDGVKTYRYMLPRWDDWLDAEITLFNPQADGREVAWEMRTDQTSSVGGRDRFEEKFSPNPKVGTANGLFKPGAPGKVVTYRLDGQETGGNLVQPTPLRLVLEFVGAC